MHSIDLILTLTGAFGVAVICGYATNRIGLSPIVGYLFAGLLVGPYTPGYVADQHLAEELSEVGAHESIVVGYGPIGRTVTRLLKDNGLSVSVLEMNLETTERLRAEGMEAVYGDASSVDALIAAGVMDARSLIVSASGMSGIEETIRIAKELNPRIRVLVRTAHLREAAALRAAGADQVFSGEAEVALAFTAEILETLGATPEQIERERARVHEELR